jgi:hypothetical protein
VVRTCSEWFALHLNHAGTGIELEVLFDAAFNGGRLDWADVIPNVQGRGPLLVIARTNKGFVRSLQWH